MPRAEAGCFSWLQLYVVLACLVGLGDGFPLIWADEYAHQSIMPRAEAGCFSWIQLYVVLEDVFL